MKQLVLIAVVCSTLVGCLQAPEAYQRAAERYAKSKCEVVGNFRHSYGDDQSKVIANGSMKYTCHTPKGGSVEQVKYIDIPSDYFKE